MNGDWTVRELLENALDDGNREVMRDAIEAALALMAAREVAGYTTTSTHVEPMTRESMERSLRELGGLR